MNGYDREYCNGQTKEKNRIENSIFHNQLAANLNAAMRLLARETIRSDPLPRPTKAGAGKSKILFDACAFLLNNFYV